MSDTTEQVKAITMRMPEAILDHLDYAHKVSELSKTVLCRRALEAYLIEKFPVPGVHNVAQ